MSCAISVNIPFVTGRCDFYGRNLYPNTAPAVKHAYLDALITEARSVGDDLGESVSCVAFEGGALGTIEPQKLREFLFELASALPLADDCFVSAEVDPGLLSTATMDELLAFGISMLRLHCLTSNPIESEWLDRAGAVGEMAKSRIVRESAGYSGGPFGADRENAFENLAGACTFVGREPLHVASCARVCGRRCRFCG